MSELPTFISTAQAPSTTGVGSLDYVPAEDPMGKQLQQLGGIGKKIAENIFLVENQQALSHANINAKIKLSRLRTELSKMDPSQALGVAEGRIQTIFDESSAGLSRVSLDEFNKSFGMLRAETSINIQKDYVANIADKAKGNLLISLNSYSKMFNPREGRLEKQIAFKSAMRDINTLVKNGHISIEEGTKDALKFKKNFVKTAIDQLIRETPTEDLDDLAKWMANDNFPKVHVVQSGYPTYDENEAFRSFWNQLDDTEKLKLQKEVGTMHENRLNILDKSKKREIFNKKTDQAKETATLKKSIIQQKRTDDTSDDEVTETVLLDKLEDGLINYEQYLDLSADVVNKDPVESDSDAIKDLFSRIRNATSNKDLDEIIKDAEGKLGVNGELTFEAFQIVERRALAAKGNTQAEREKKRYSAALEKIVSSADWLDKILPGAKDRAALIILDFEARISGEDPEPPATAFANALEAFRTRGKVELNAIPRPQFGPVSKKLGEWTLEDVSDAKLATRNQFKGKPSVLATQMIMLNALEQYISQRDANDPSGGKKPDPNRKGQLKDLRGGN